MGNLILKNDQIILHCANWVMDILHSSMLEVVHEENLLNNSHVMNFIEHLNQEMYGRGCIYLEITEFFPVTPNDHILSLQKITIKAIHKLKSITTINEEVIKRLEDFSKTLV